MSKTNGKSVNDDVAIERDLFVSLTKEELRERGASMSAAELQIEQLKLDRKPINTKIREQTDLRNELAHTIKRGEERRTVICKWIAYHSENRWSLVRQDTGEEIEAKAMTADDRQVPLDLDAVGAVEVVDVTAPLPEAKREKLAAAMKAHKPKKVAAKKAAPKSRAKSKAFAHAHA